MALFFSRNDERKRWSAEVPRDEKLKEELSELLASEEPREISRAITEAEEAVSLAARDEIRRIKIIEQGRCPECRGRTENFLYTAVCQSCGWFRRLVPDSGTAIVHMDSGDQIKCDRVYEVRNGQILCVNDGVVVSQVNRTFVRRVEYVWAEHELAEARERIRKERIGVCSWCERDLSGADKGGPFETYAAFGSLQERYVFCSRKCLESFARQYPSRVHRNCYETDCADCNKCIQRYDTESYRKDRIVQ